jgi:hypothetical protein
MTGGSRIPQSEAGDAVGVNVFRCALEFRENREGMTRVRRLFVPYLEQDSAIALNNEGTVHGLFSDRE